VASAAALLASLASATVGDLAVAQPPETEMTLLDPEFGEPIRFRVGTRTFDVPLKYLITGIAEPKTRTIEALSFYFWMPDGKPTGRGLSQAPVQFWRQPDSGAPPLRPDQHIVSVRTVRPIPSRRRSPEQMLAIYDTQVDLGMEFGLFKMDLHPDKQLPAWQQDFTYSTRGHLDVEAIFDCARAGMFEGLPSTCRGRVWSKLDDLEIYVHFLADYMRDWRLIAERVLELARSWEKAAGAKPINHP
jgi:hypothetical protein